MDGLGSAGEWVDMVAVRRVTGERDREVYPLPGYRDIGGVEGVVRGK